MATKRQPTTVDWAAHSICNELMLRLAMEEEAAWEIAYGILSRMQRDGVHVHKRER